MGGYRNPAKSQTTNISNHGRLRDLIDEGRAVDILVPPDNGLMRYGQFHLNLAAGLEDSLIQVINPPWNGGKKETASAESETENDIDEPLEVFPRFTITLHPTYRHSGFFNVGTANEALLGPDGEKIEFFLGESDEAILGTINRTANTNGTPRLMGGTGLRQWFQSEFAEMDILEVEVLSPLSIRLRRR